MRGNRDLYFAQYEILNGHRSSLFIAVRQIRIVRTWRVVAPLRARARTRTLTPRRAGPNPFRFITALLARETEALLLDPALNYDWTRYIDPRRSSSILIRGVSRSCA